MSKINPGQLSPISPLESGAIDSLASPITGAELELKIREALADVSKYSAQAQQAGPADPAGIFTLPADGGDQKEVAVKMNTGLHEALGGQAIANGADVVSHLAKAAGNDAHDLASSGTAKDLEHNFNKVSDQFHLKMSPEMFEKKRQALEASMAYQREHEQTGTLVDQSQLRAAADNAQQPTTQTAPSHQKMSPEVFEKKRQALEANMAYQREHEPAGTLVDQSQLKKPVDSAQPPTTQTAPSHQKMSPEVFEKKRQALEANMAYQREHEPTGKLVDQSQIKTPVDSAQPPTTQTAPSHQKMSPEVFEKKRQALEANMAYQREHEPTGKLVDQSQIKTPESPSAHRSNTIEDMLHQKKSPEQIQKGIDAVEAAAAEARAKETPGKLVADPQAPAAETGWFQKKPATTPEPNDKVGDRD